MIVYVDPPLPTTPESMTSLRLPAGRLSVRLLIQEPPGYAKELTYANSRPAMGYACCYVVYLFSRYLII